MPIPKMFFPLTGAIGYFSDSQKIDCSLTLSSNSKPSSMKLELVISAIANDTGKEYSTIFTHPTFDHI
jgi:hypothetical protein